MVGEGCGRQIQVSEHYFYLQRGLEKWFPFINEASPASPYRRCQDYSEEDGPIIARRCHECAVRLGIIW